MGQRFYNTIWVKKESSLKLYFPREKWKTNKTIIFFKRDRLTFSTRIPTCFLLVEPLRKLLIWSEPKPLTSSVSTNLNREMIFQFSTQKKMSCHAKMKEYKECTSIVLCLTRNISNPVGCSCRIRKVRLCRGVGSLLPVSVRVKTLNHLMIRLQSWNFGETGEHFHCNYFQIHPLAGLLYLLGFNLWIN